MRKLLRIGNFKQPLFVFKFALNFLRLINVVTCTFISLYRKQRLKTE